MQTTVEPVAEVTLQGLDAWWRAANYLAVGMIYLQDNPLLREPLRPEHIKNRLLGHWGSSPGQAFIWAQANRLIRERDLDMIYLSGPGHGAPGVLGPTYLDGSYSEIYPDKSRDAAGLGSAGLERRRRPGTTRAAHRRQPGRGDGDAAHLPLF
jgi:xylulose-5-phosphate/fructose-6-phosphate phosphoketolase